MVYCCLRPLRESLAPRARNILLYSIHRICPRPKALYYPTQLIHPNRIVNCSVVVCLSIAIMHCSVGSVSVHVFRGLISFRQCVLPGRQSAPPSSNTYSFDKRSRSTCKEEMKYTGRGKGGAPRFCKKRNALFTMRTSLKSHFMYIDCAHLCVHALAMHCALAPAANLIFASSSDFKWFHLVKLIQELAVFFSLHIFEQVHLWFVQSARTHMGFVWFRAIVWLPFLVRRKRFRTVRIFMFFFYALHEMCAYWIWLFLNIIFVMRLMGKWDEEHMAEGVTKPSFSLKKKLFALSFNKGTFKRKTPLDISHSAWSLKLTRNGSGDILFFISQDSTHGSLMVRVVRFCTLFYWPCTQKKIRFL